jgi:hypothetical protein
MNTVSVKKSIKDCMKANLVPFVVGSPGIAKSAIVAEIAKEEDMILVDLRLAQMDAVDIGGLPYPEEEYGTFSYYTLDMFPVKGLVDKPKRDVLILLDELSSCTPDVQVSAYALILDRKVGNHYLHDNVYLVAAGNKDTDRAVTSPMSTALVSRLVHLELDLDTESWLDWARGKVDDRIISFITYRPDLLSTFSDFEQEDTLTYAVPRTYEMLSKLLKNIPTISYNSLELFNGVIGAKASQAFVTFCKVYSDIPAYKDIVESPRDIAVSERGDINSAIVTVLNSQVRRTDINKVTLYVNRMPIEYQVVFYQTLTKNNKLLLISQSVKTWMSNNHSLFN